MNAAGCGGGGGRQPPAEPMACSPLTLLLLTGGGGGKDNARKRWLAVYCPQAHTKSFAFVHVPEVGHLPQAGRGGRCQGALASILGDLHVRETDDRSGVVGKGETGWGESERGWVGGGHRRTRGTWGT